MRVFRPGLHGAAYTHQTALAENRQKIRGVQGGMLPHQEQHIGSIKFALMRALPDWEAVVNRRTDENGNEAYTVSLTKGRTQMRGYHEVDESAEHIARHYSHRLLLNRSTG